MHTSPTRSLTFNDFPNHHVRLAHHARLAWCLLFASTFILALGCGSSPADSVAENKSKLKRATTPVLIQLNWFPETEHGGVYAAQASGLFEKAGLDVTIRAGGQGTRIGGELATGRVQFAFANADDVVLFRQEGVDAVAVLAAMQNHPRCILVRADSGINKFEDLAGNILQCQPGQCFLTFMESKGLLDGVQQVPYSGSIAALVSTKNTAVQAYSFSEPLVAQQQGVDVKMLMLSDLGWNPYSSVLVTTGDLIRTQPELVREVVLATQQGWHDFIQDPKLANAAILKVNSEAMTPEVLAFGYEGFKTLAMPADFKLSQVGSMTSARWEELVDQMTQLGLTDGSTVKAADCFTTKFLAPESLQ